MVEDLEAFISLARMQFASPAGQGHVTLAGARSERVAAGTSQD